MIRPCQEWFSADGVVVRSDVCQRGDHIHVDVWIGTDREHLASAGHLCCRAEEWEALRVLLGFPDTQ